MSAAGSGTQTANVTARSVSDGVTNTTVLITSATAAFVSGDVGRIVTGSTDIPAIDWIAVVSSGTNANLKTAETGSHSAQTFALSTEYVLLSVNAVGLYTFNVDASAMAAGDVTELRVYQIVITGGTPRVAFYQRYTDAQAADDMIKVSVAIGNDITDTDALLFTLKQTAGTGRAYPWKVLKLA